MTYYPPQQRNDRSWVASSGEYNGRYIGYSGGHDGGYSGGDSGGCIICFICLSGLSGGGD